MIDTPNGNKKVGKVPDEKQEPVVGDDQETHRYYYDDAHGYEDYDSNESDDEDGDEMAD